MSYSTENPGHGNLGEINGFGINQTSRVSHCTEVSSGVSQILGSEAAASWQSASATAWRERMMRVIPTIDAAGAVAHDWAAAAQKYHYRLGAMTSQAAAANRDINTGHSMLHAYSQMPTEITGTYQYVAKADAYEADIREGHQTLNYLESLRYGDDATFVYALNARGTAGSFTQWLSLQSIYGDAKSVADIRNTRIALADEYEDLGNKVINSTATTEEIAALASFLATSSGDPALAAEFWSRFTGDEATSMLSQGVADQFATGDPSGDTSLCDAAAVAFAQGLRASLAAASTTWDEATAGQFAEQLFVGPGNPPAQGQVTGARGEIGYLFDDADGNPMSRYFTVAMADLIDTFERGVDDSGGQNGRFTSGASDVLDGGNTTSSIIDALWIAEGNGDPNVSTLATSDPMSRVLDTLGLYPDAAWDWLSSNDNLLTDGNSATGGDRVDYYSQRDWGIDGYDGFGSLWEGSMHADGGLGSSVSDDATWDEQCDAASRIVAGIDSGGHLSVGTISDGGASRLGNALGQLIPFIEYQGLTTVGQPSPGTPQWVTHDPLVFIAANGDGNIPYLDKNAFGDLVAAVVSNDNGFVPMRQAVTQVENQLIIDANEMAAAFPNDRRELWNTALGRYASLEASFEGAVGGAEILQARIEDQAVRNQMALGEFALNFIPGVGGAAGGVIDIGIGTAAGGGVDSLTDYLASSEREADGSLDSSQRSGASGVASMIGTLTNRDDCNLNISYPNHMQPDTWIGTFTADHDESFYSSVWKATDNV